MARGFFPLDEELGLGPGAFSPPLTERIAWLGTRLPFEQVPDALLGFTRVTIGEDTARRLTEAAGGALVVLEDAEIEQLKQEDVPTVTGPTVQQVSVDGAMVPLVHGLWAEAKTIAIGTVGTRRKADGTVVVQTRELTYCSRLTDAEGFRDVALLEMHRRGTRTAGTVCAVADGAEWIQRLFDWRCPGSVRILDFPHAAEHVSLAAHAVLGESTEAVRAWLNTQLHELKHGDPDRVLAELRALASQTTVVEEQERCAETLRYLEARRSQLAYADFQARGYPIGSGIVESANKLVVEARLKGAGMHWARPNVNPMVALRDIACSGRWNARWPLIWSTWRQQVRAGRAARRCARHPVPPPCTPTESQPTAPASSTATQTTSRSKRWGLEPKGLMKDGRPTADHPLKRGSVVRPRTPSPDLAKL